MIAARYTLGFMAAVILLSAGALFAFARVGEIAALANAPPPIDTLAEPGPPPVDAAALIRPDDEAWDSLAAGDSAWRAQHARWYSLAELRARGDGRRGPREAMQDRVYAHVRAGRQAQAIRELETWVRRRPNDEEALLWLARLLSEAGRADEAAARYRALLSRQRGGR